MDENSIYQIERPHKKLATLYVIRSILTGPLIIISLPAMLIRYSTMRYRFDADGVSMSWGVLFRRSIDLNYSKMQDIHLTSGPLQRWLGLADVHIQTASGSASAEMTIEGILEFEAVRDFLYARMRGVNDSERRGQRSQLQEASGVAFPPEALEILKDIHAELREARVALSDKSKG